jgi:hypothetical protein
MSTQQTDFSELLSNRQPVEAYGGVATVDNATTEGEYQANTKSLQKPVWILRPLPRPPVKLIG